MKKIFESKLVLCITFIPYVIILFAAVYNAVVGTQWMESWHDGWRGVIDTLWITGVVLVYSPLKYPFLFCIIYQVVYFKDRHKKRKEE